MICSRRLYKGNSYEICLPLADSSVTLARFYTAGDVIIEKVPEITGDSMCFSFTEEEIASLPDGVLRYELVTEYETTDTNSPYVIVTPGDYSGSTLEDMLEDAYESGLTSCSGSSCELQTEKGLQLNEMSFYYMGSKQYSVVNSEGTGPGNIIVSPDSGYDGMEQVVVGGSFYAREAFQDGYNEAYDYAYERGYMSGETDGMWYGYEVGFSSGVTNQKAKLSAITITENGIYSGQDGYSAVTVDVPNGYQEGYVSGMTDGFDSGVTYQKSRMQGFTATYTSNASWVYEDKDNGYDKIEITIAVPSDSGVGYTSGYTDGYNDGWLPGYNSGRTDGFRDGYVEGWQPGWEAGYIDGYNAAASGNPGYEEGYQAGYNAGVTDQKGLLASTAITENGPYYRADGWNSVTVTVAQTGYTQEDLDAAFASGFSAGYDSGLTDCSGDTPSAATAITITVPQNLKPGDTGSTSVSTSPQDAPTNLTYSSSDSTVATVDSNGNITAVGTGTTNICVTDSISQITECVQLTVNQSLLGDGDVTATVLPRLATSAVPLCSSSNLGSVSKMAIDGVEITPVSAYTFGDTNLHTLDVWYLSSTIPYSAFEYADRLKDVVIKDRMTVIGGRAFFYCTGITSVQIGSGITTINNSAFQGDKSITSITIPDAVNTMGTYVFSGCTSMISATIGTGMTTIPDGMFSVCSALTQVTVNGNVTEIGAEAFNECKSLTAYPFTNSLAVISQSAFKGCESLTSVVLPDSVVSAGTNAFEGCTGLTAVTLSTGLTEIANNMFSSCGTLQSVSLPDSITKIGERSFEGCSAMTSVVFGSGLTEIGDYAFQNCSYLRGIDIPETISKIGAYSFRFDTALQVYGITVRNTTPPWLGNQAFASTDDAPIYVPAGSVETYKTSTTLHYYWADYANRIQAIQ